MNRLFGLPTLACLTLSVTSPAQNQVWIVDDTFGAGVNFTNLQAAINTVADGDVLLVRPGTYSLGIGVYTLSGKSLTIQADGATAPFFQNGFVIRDLAPEQRVVVRGLTVNTFLNTGPGVVCKDNQGSVWIEGCSLSASNFSSQPQLPASHGVEADHSASVALARCTIKGGSGINTGKTGLPGVRCLASNVALYDCTVSGGDGGVGFADIPPALPGGPGAAGALIESGLVFASGCAIHGGNGGNGGSAIFSGACTNGGDGGVGLYLGTGAPEVWLLDSTHEGGAGGVGPGACGDGQAGAPLVQESGALNMQSGESRSLATNSPVREGQTLTLTMTGEPGDLAFIDLSAGPGFLLLPGLHGVLLLGLPFTTVFAGTVPAAGPLTLNAAIHELGAGIEGVPLFLQSGYFSFVDGIFQAGHSAVTLLDSAF